MSYLERIQACNNVCFDRLHPWLIDGVRYGWIADDFALRLRDYPEVFVSAADGLTLHPQWQGHQQRSQAVNTVMLAMHQAGVIDTWVNELYPVTLSFAGESMLDVERAAASFLGVRSFGVHVNGLVQRADGIHVWVGKRSSAKPFWPGMLDQMVAGGQPSGISLLDNVIKEAAEEASVPRELAAAAVPVGRLYYQYQGWRGLEDSIIFVYDMWLPASFEPVNSDGEVDGFRLISLAELAALTEHQLAFKDNCNLVNIDLLLRNGLIDEQHPDYQAITSRLYQQPG